MTEAGEKDRTAASLRSFAYRVLVAVAIVAAALLLWRVRFVLTLGFAAVIVATVLVAAGEPFRKWGHFSHRWSVVAGGVVITLLIGGFGWLIFPVIQSQWSQLVERLPGSLQELEKRIGQLPEPIAEMAPSSLLPDIAQYFTSWTTTLLGMLASLVLIVIAGSFLATTPNSYRNGLVSLVPSRMRESVRHGVDAVGHALRQWLLAQFISMLIVGVLIATGAWLLGLPSPLALGVVAALTEFVPILGPILGSVPALLVALSGGYELLLWTLLLFVIVQQLESNMIMPLIQQEMAHVPPVVLLLAIAAFGTVLGFPGVLLGAPMTVAVFTFVKDVYFDRHSRPTARGEHRGTDARGE